jgi:hypothetical protein
MHRFRHQSHNENPSLHANSCFSSWKISVLLLMSSANYRSILHSLFESFSFFPYIVSGTYHAMKTFVFTCEL